MKLIVRHSGFSSVKTLDAMVRREMQPLEPLRQIDEARVYLTQEHAASPPFHVHAHLVTPGPDVFAEARDHTLAAALAKVTKRLAQAIQMRADKRSTRMKSLLQTPRLARPAPVKG
jgi:hypothetical protein